jgi:hypothetical protein
VCLTLASVYYNNPEAVKSRSEAWGPFNQAVAYGDGSGAGLSASLGRYRLEHVG